MMYGYKTPKSKMLIRGITKDAGRMYVDNGFASRGSIWCPGDLKNHPEIGDLYARIQTWRDAQPLGTSPDYHFTPPDAAARNRMAEMMRKFLAGIPVNDEVASLWAKMEPYGKSGNPAYVGSTKSAPKTKPMPKTEAELSGDWPQPDQKLFETIYMTKGIADDDVGKPREGGT